MPKIKEVYEYNNGSWANGTPIGADASNVDVALSDSTSTKDLQSVLGNVSVSDPSMKTQLTGKVNASGGDIKDTVVNVLDPASETDTSEDIDGTDVVVAAGESQTTMWSKFNMFRKRVSNKFSNFLISSVEDVLEPSDTKTYSQAALNSYFADVIGYKTDADVATVGSVADQLSTLNNNLLFEPLLSSQHGVLKIASIKLAIIWGAQRADSFGYESARGAYTHTLDLSPYHLTGPVWGTAGPQYNGGIPFVGVAFVTTTSIMLLCNINLNDCYIYWLVISPYSD